MQQSLSKTVIITGASKGLGRAMAYKLASLSYNLVLCYLSDDETATETYARCREIHPQVLLVKADISKKHEVTTLMQESYQAFHSIDVLINNAGLNIDKPLHEITEDDWDRVVDTNLKGTFLCSQIASRYMLQQQQGGSIINIGASTAIRGRKNGANYCSSKAGVLVLTKCLALELAPKVRVNCLIPGFTRTEETEHRFRLDQPENLRSVAGSIPLQRIGEPEDVADVVSFLVSDQARYFTGQKLIVDGGEFMF
jgi:3-oxoacyl-[acyl-carrier protein] reductase